ncbi:MULTISPECIES: cytochrome P450 [Amycolatopsis methanolica group]|uniref:Cytochrome P450 n=1 Tax=Amycolatopsis methanolica 239 TaxID=1068978 RepID=A0A076MVC1_AMYME|nr:cytochrome P450 [Amycolatopsis methanolica]AIJ24659.1 cytochrome P450 [Amycolatopsis methanolica 239]
MTATVREFDTIDISDMAFWARPPHERERVFAQLRRERPVSWQRPVFSPLMGEVNEAEAGYWAVVRNADIVTVSRHAEVFSSATGGVTFEDMPSEILEMATSILTMDAPRHGKVRRLISSTFTPKRLALIQDQIANQARRIVDAIAPLGEVEFVSAVSARLPMWTISEMIGIPEENRDEVHEAANLMISWDDEEVTGGLDAPTAMLNGIATLHGVCQDVIEARRAKPADDLLTALTQAEVDGARLTDDEIRSFFVLLCVAGNDTTKQTTTHTLRALTEFPDQRRLLMEDFDGRIDGAVEEFVRWASPVMTFRRTALEPFELAGQRIEAGDKVVMFYSSGNRDEEAFDRPGTFDITRDNRRHVAFGGRGPHYCLGNHLAKTQLKLIFSELLTRLPDIRADGEPEYLTSTFINGIKSQRCVFTPER